MAKRNAPSGPCRLCGVVGELCHSHVIPEFMYKDLYDGNHRGVIANAYSAGREEVFQKGYREYLLCQACETRFSGWETPATPVWRGMLQLLRGAAPGSVFTVPANYATLKLFSLSILWRASIAAHDNFAAVDLGSFEPLVRSMLLSRTPGAVTEFQSLAVAWANLNDLVGVIGPCTRGEWSGIPTFRFNISGIQWFFFLEPAAGSLSPHPAVTHKGFTVVVSKDDEDKEKLRMAQTMPL